MTKTYHGSCVCGAVKFEADVDTSQLETFKCNCTVCGKLRYWGIKLKTEEFRLLPESSGDDVLTDYVRNHPGIHNFFCKTCGVHVFHKLNFPQTGEYITVNAACLDGIDASELAAFKVRYVDGRNNKWGQAPEVTKHL